MANCRDTRYRPVVLERGHTDPGKGSFTVADLGPPAGGRRLDLREALLRLQGGVRALELDERCVAIIPR